MNERLLKLVKKCHVIHRGDNMSRHSPILLELRSLGVGCHIAEVFYGAVGFCDDILLLSATRDAMEVMLLETT